VYLIYNVRKIMTNIPSESIRAVCNPWHSWQSLVLSGISVCLVIAWFFMPVPTGYEGLVRKLIFGAFIVLGFVNQYLREKAWRRLVSEEAPDLYKKLNDTSS
jgi:hypothetical protein